MWLNIWLNVLNSQLNILTVEEKKKHDLTTIAGSYCPDSHCLGLVALIKQADNENILVTVQKDYKSPISHRPSNENHRILSHRESCISINGRVLLSRKLPHLHGFTNSVIIVHGSHDVIALWGNCQASCLLSPLECRRSSARHGRLTQRGRARRRWERLQKKNRAAHGITASGAGSEVVIWGQADV